MGLLVGDGDLEACTDIVEDINEVRPYLISTTGIKNVANYKYAQIDQSAWVPAGTTPSGLESHLTGLGATGIMSSRPRNPISIGTVYPNTGSQGMYANGHIWKFADGIKYLGDGTQQAVLRCDNPANYSSAASSTNYTSIGNNYGGNGWKIRVEFTYANTASNPTLSVDGGTTNKTIKVMGETITTDNTKELIKGVCEFVYDGTAWNLMAELPMWGSF